MKDSADKIEKSRFPCPIGAYQANDLTFIEVKIDALYSGQTSKRFEQSPSLNQYGSIHLYTRHLLPLLIGQEAERWLRKL